MELIIYHKHAEFGRVFLKKEGKCLHFHGTFPFLPGIHRLYLEKEDQSLLPLGVLFPGEGGLTLRRTLRVRDPDALQASLRRGYVVMGDRLPEREATVDAAECAAAPALPEEPPEPVRQEETPKQVFQPEEPETETENDSGTKEKPEPIPAPVPTFAPTAEEEAPYARLDRWLETAHPEDFTEDAVLRKSLAGAEGALYRYRAGCIELALPERCHAHLSPVFLFVRAEEIRGTACFVLTLGPDGLPKPADAPSSY